MNIVLGVGGGIAAYKSALLLRLFTEAGHQVTVIPTEASVKFVGVATWEALSGRPATNSVFDAVESVNHVRIGHEADLIVVAPATADVLAKAAAGLANDLLTTTLLMARGPVLFAPAMHTEMWRHAATAANVATLRSRGVHVLEPATGRLTGPDSGPGRLPEPAEIFAAAMALVEGGRPSAADDAGSPAPVPSPGTDRSAGTAPSHAAAGAPAAGAAPADGSSRLLAGKRVVITAGGTREPLDPVRFLGNKSSGKQGVALAESALAAGAEVMLIHGHMDVAPPPDAKLHSVDTALELRAATLSAAAGADVVIMAAAVADFRPATISAGKIKKRDDVADPVIKLVRNPDILVEVVAHRAAQNLSQLIVGFAAETGDEEHDARSYAEAKLARKGCDLLVVNEVGPGETGQERVFGRDGNQVEILARDGAGPVQAAGSKRQVADAVVRVIAERLGTT
ncbi:phosphopantothenate--cysteine ligase family flavoprotein [Arthrobacter sp. SDTb3-6]|uniref:bifunctional phosphopantothenoylcysteine decarboxylase/phosphopantothenate synthase n=1 Tax=Arthrobacter sp. SDTb3-6 TaxID=2713571 RepID=UPI00159D07C8|nr:bifunctional phosphopantothenoylcysteine decarboxylase/phosphopantothenate synthase [Arthrobacter sp. SDTb3-6]NVM97934.1 bifunctional phosphopantothenoylcysteine decarboxylase/phosphopantothenate synthase [Arthrobacter sp. SDTb3-6]